MRPCRNSEGNIFVTWAGAAIYERVKEFYSRTSSTIGICRVVRCLYVS